MLKPKKSFNTIVKLTRSKITSITRTDSCWSKHESSVFICAFAVFTSIVIIVGVLTVCFTSPHNSNKTCQRTFDQTIERAIRYDSRPCSVATADFNKDSYFDLVVANSGTDNIGILLGYDNATFAIQITYSTGPGSRPYSIAAADFDNDTIPDIAVANYGTNSIGVLLGRGDGTFESQITFSLGPSRPLSLAVGDFDNDNQYDIAVVSYGTSTVAILLGLGNGSFRIGTIYNMGYDSIPYSIVVADFNSDNQLDMAIVNYGTSNLVVLLQDRNETFVSHLYSTGYGSYPCSVAVGDFNNDNTLDIVIANSGSSNVGVFLGHENGTFTNIKTYPAGTKSRPQFVAVGHFTNDTNLDIVVADSGNNNLLIFKGDGNQTCVITTTHSTGFNSDPLSIVVSNFDNDHIPDIVIANNGTNNILVLAAYTIDANTSQTTYTAGTNSESNSIAVGDFNNDNQLDIVVASGKNNYVGILMGLGNGTFGSQKIYPVGNDTQPNFVAIGDFNNDNQLDIAVALYATSNILLFLGYGNGTFRYGDIFSSNGFNPYSLTVEDFNNDNNLDIAAVNYNSNGFSIFLGYGNGTFTSVTSSIDDSLNRPIFVSAGDFNNDGLLDLAIANYWGNSISILFGNGDGYFSNLKTILIDAGSPSSIAIHDLNNDNQLDIVFTIPSYSSVGVVLGNGNGTFGNITSYLTGSGSHPWSVAIGIFNNDSIPDIAVVNAYHSDLGIFLGNNNGTFAKQKTFSTGDGSLPYSIAFGDFNNDKQQDIVVGNSGTNTIGVFLVHYVAEFTYEKSYLTGSSPNPYSLTMGDFNNDSWLDITVTNSGNDNIQILINDGKDILFLNKTIYSTGSGSHPEFVTIADFNKNRQLDIAVANFWNHNILVFPGYGDGTFDVPTVYSTGSASFPKSIAVGDFNNDSWIDMVVVHQGTDSVGVFLGFDYTTFTSRIIQLNAYNSAPYYVVAAHFSNDSQWDIVIANRVLDSISVFLANEDGMFTTQTFYYMNYLSYPVSIAVGDFNNDNLTDIAVANSGDNGGVSVFLGYGNGTFTEQILSSTDSLSSVSIAIGDFNNDSKLDVVVANRYGNSVGILFGQGNGTFAQQILYLMPENSAPVWVVVSDFNNDSILDIAVANFDEDTVGVIVGNGDGTFRNITMYPTGNNSGPCSIAVGDLNNDSFPDIVVANQRAQNVGVFLGYGNGSFSSQTTFSTDSQSNLTSIAIGQLNNDLVLDIVVSDNGNGNGNIGIFYGHGDGDFIPFKTYSMGLNSQPTSIGICDFDNDGHADLVVTNSNKNSVGIMLQDKSEPFNVQTILSTGNNSRPSSVAVGDFNNDDRLDIAVANTDINNIGILLGYGNGSFDTQKTFSTGDTSRPISIAVSDFNNDNQLDIAVANTGTDNIGILLGHVNGTFAPITTYFTGKSSIPSFVAVADVNKDNHLDIAIANWGINTVVIYFGDGTGSFANPVSYSMGYDARPQSIAIGDFDNDRWLDMAVANYGADSVAILLQKC